MLPREITEPHRVAFLDRVCLACGRRGGGDPEAGLDNVNAIWGVEACGHCLDAYYEQRNEGAAFRRWAEGWKRSLEATKP